ncbi:unnamed protein product [Cuscuta campestris]|uniref:Tf2-1-like SH3-like domain-containing protein n=1 Tax=Cuscuta campestris TaxID=132261 RepID=A0A484NBP2_9ASTE|nr:unnamed protein product [Cuscuta campestris]
MMEPFPEGIESEEMQGWQANGLVSEVKTCARGSVILGLKLSPEGSYLHRIEAIFVSTPKDRLNEFVKKLRPDLRLYAALITTTDFNAAYDLIVKTEKSLDDLQATKKEDRATKDPRPAASAGPSGKSFGFGGKRYKKGSSSAPPPKRRHFRRHCPTNPSSELVFPRAPDQPAASHPARSQQSTAANNQQRPRPQQTGRAPARTYAMQGRTDPNFDVILGTFILFDSVMHALIDPGSTLSYICVGMPANSTIVRSDLEIPTVVSNPLGHSMRFHHIYHRCPLSVQGKQFPADLIELPHKEFDIILGMDWLTEHGAVVDCSSRTIWLRADDGSNVSLSGEVFPKAPEFISPMSARRLICKKCEMFLCHVQDMRKESPRQQDIPTVCDFPDVFPEDLPELSERKLEGPDIVQDTEEKVRVIRDRLRAASDRQKSYADLKRRDREYNVGDMVFLKVSPWKKVLRFGKKGKLSPRFIGPYRILERIGAVAYRLELPPELNRIHDVFHVSMLRRYRSDPTHVLPTNAVTLDESLSYEEEPVKILARETKVLRNKTVPLVKAYHVRVFRSDLRAARPGSSPSSSSSSFSIVAGRRPSTAQLVAAASPSPEVRRSLPESAPPTTVPNPRAAIRRLHYRRLSSSLSSYSAAKPNAGHRQLPPAAVALRTPLAPPLYADVRHRRRIQLLPRIDTTGRLISTPDELFDSVF